ncbi:PKD-like family lipoprotein [Pedobacter frigoris]|uniref:PKD-like family protein n=1 Tax=Pedobacter frigoris TaxID=2571272 RepID=A0A4U1CGB0_9SPHI|nr:PKD-like family lipoprotein [Pedobacter frigoris]TKC06188.1 hypothetical protein FA047_12765 [Pedobacter frigoris]
MKIFQYTVLLVSALLLSSCAKDLGTYEYNDINDVKIVGINGSYSARRGVDTLRITPTLTATMDSGDTTRYRYLWIVREGTNLDTIGRFRNLNYPVTLPPLAYKLFYRIRDKQTGVEWQANADLMIGTPFSRGWLIMGEDEQGYAEAEMLSMQNDTLHLKHILSESGLPRLREPMSLQHTGGGLESYMKLWAMTKSGSYFLDRVTMKSTPGNNMSRVLYISETIDPQTLHPIVIAPQIRTAAGLISSTNYRVMLTKSGDIFASFLAINGGDFYNNPINRVATAQDVRIPAAPYLLYATGSMTTAMWYDTVNQRFLNYSGFGLATSSTVLADVAGAAFPWNQGATGRSLVYAENTRNTDGGSTNGNSFAIMKDPVNVHHIYKFYANGSAPAKRAAYVVSAIATDFDKATFYAFSSNRTVVFYAAGNKLYAYDYNPGNERIYQYPEIGNDQITMLKFDTQVDHLQNSLYIATYNSATKGTMKRYRVGTNPNVVELLPQDNSTWSGLVKVKDINWRAVN